MGGGNGNLFRNTQSYTSLLTRIILITFWKGRRVFCLLFCFAANSPLKDASWYYLGGVTPAVASLLLNVISKCVHGCGFSWFCRLVCMYRLYGLDSEKFYPPAHQTFYFQESKNFHSHWNSRRCWYLFISELHLSIFILRGKDVSSSRTLNHIYLLVEGRL